MNQEHFSNFNQAIETLKGNSSAKDIENTLPQPSYSIQPFQTPRILFIVGDPNSLDPDTEKIFVDRLNLTLNYEVVLHDDNGSYSYSNFDAILISGTVVEEGSPSFIDSLYTAPIPILTFEHGNYNEFELGSSSSYLGALPGQIWILNNSHYITAGYPEPSLKTGITIYTASGELDAVTGYDKGKPVGCQILELAQTSTSPAHSNRRNLVVLEKGNKDWQLNPTVERRAFWGGVQGNLFTFDGWKLWERTVKWILYDDDNGNATINVNTVDLNGNPVSNANVTLINSSDPLDVITHYTDQDGKTTFTNLSFCEYDIYARNDLVPNSLNSTYMSQEIIGTRTFYRETVLNYIIILNFSLNNDPPVITNILFQNISGTYTFFADVFDVDPIDSVFLNMTVYNTSNYLAPYIPPKNYTMRLQSGNPGESGIYYNDTALGSLNHTAVEVFYNLIADDSVGNTTVTPIQSIILEDIEAPIICGYNAIDYGNGSIGFWANVSDPSSIQDPVSLKIDNDIYEMHMNTSGLWTYKGNFYYNSLLNYTLYSVN
ncbi:MAG: carboxypeptidase-like regulatory domain-containing protein, partial [Candidatus Hermodarchaeota archaeon]